MFTEPSSATAVLDALFAGLAEVGVDWALLRGRANLGQGRDVDLLVRGDHIECFDDLVFELGGLRVPFKSHPWHRLYVLPDRSSGAEVKLDVVTRLIYNRRLQIPSELESGCLDRCVKDGALNVLDPTDMFWTVLLHCILDKREISKRRAAELVAVLDELRRPSPGEDFFRTLCPPGWSPDRALQCVRERDWRSLGQLRDAIVPSHTPAPPAVVEAAAGQATTQRPRGPVRGAVRAAYFALWRRAGLGAIPRVLDTLEASPSEATILRLRRRPAVCEVVLLVADDQRHSVERALRAAHYLPAAGSWHRLTGVGLERVRLLSESWLGSGQSLEQVRAASLPVAGRPSCRRAVGAGSWSDGESREAGARWAGARRLLTAGTGEGRKE